MTDKPLPELFVDIVCWLINIKTIGWLVMYGVLICGGFVLLIGVVQLLVPGPPPILPDGFHITLRALETQWIGQRDNFIELTYFNEEGEPIGNVELTGKVIFRNAEVYKFKQYKTIWSSYETLRIIVPVAQPIERVEIRGFYYNGEHIAVEIGGLWTFDTIDTTGSIKDLEPNKE